MPLPVGYQELLSHSFIPTSTTEADGAPGQRVVLYTAAGGTTPPFNLAQVGGTTVVTAGVAGLLAVGGAGAAGAAISGNPLPIAGLINGSGNVTTLATIASGDLRVALDDSGGNGINSFNNPADGVSRNVRGLAGFSQNLLLVPGAPTTLDFQREMANALNSTGTGITSAGLVAQLDDTSPTILTENQFGNVRLDAARALRVNHEGMKTTYSVSVVGFTPAATPTDVIAIGGSATTTVRVTRIEVSGLATTAGVVPILLIKRSVADTAGTPVSDTLVPHDSTNAAATATVVHYTANPSVGAAVGQVRAERLELTVAAGTTGADRIVWDFTLRSEQALVLRGTAQQLCINLNGVTLPAGAVLDYDVSFTEEA